MIYFVKVSRTELIELGSKLKRPGSSTFLDEINRFMEKTKFARKLDSMGRITVPARLREQCGLELNEIYEYYICEVDGKKYLCIECPKNKN